MTRNVAKSTVKGTKPFDAGHSGAGCSGSGRSGTGHSGADRSAPVSPLTRFYPMIRQRNEVLEEIHQSHSMTSQFYSWNQERREEFLDICSGNKGLKILYDGFFKEILNPEVKPERLNSLLTQVLGYPVTIQMVYPNDSVRLGDTTLIYTDLLVQLEDGSLANVEIQKIGYAFPGERGACYGADHLLRQYRMVRSQKGSEFTYHDIKNVYIIVFFESSPKIFKEYPDHLIHHFSQQSDSGLKMNLLQEFYFLPLDIFQKSRENRSIDTLFEAWLGFLSFDQPERICELIQGWPEFKEMYEDIYKLCRNTERMMWMYSEELAILDRNTIKFMMDEMQEEIDQQKAELNQKDKTLNQQAIELNKKDAQIEELRKRLAALESQQ